jgi:hypothetical protein
MSIGYLNFIRISLVCARHIPIDTIGISVHNFINLFMRYVIMSNIYTAADQLAKRNE